MWWITTIRLIIINNSLYVLLDLARLYYLCINKVCGDKQTNQSNVLFFSGESIYYTKIRWENKMLSVSVLQTRKERHVVQLHCLQLDYLQPSL